MLGVVAYAPAAAPDRIVGFELSAALACRWGGRTARDAQAGVHWVASTNPVRAAGGRAAGGRAAGGPAAHRPAARTSAGASAH